MSVFYSDRSRVVKHQACPRSRWYAYEAPNGGKVNGVVPTALNMDLLTGSTFHEGLASLLSGEGVEDAVGKALEGSGDWKGYWSLVKASGLALEPGEDASYVVYEQAAMAEALIRGYEKVVLPELLERFEVVEVEYDEEGVFEIGESRMIWGMRGDSLLQEKSSLDLYVHSLKTKKEWKKNDDRKNRYDMQGLSETATVEQRLGEWQRFLDKAPGGGVRPDWDSRCKEIPKWFVDRYNEGASPTIMGVKMEFALKGRRSEYPKGSGRRVYSNPLIRPWKKADDLRSSGGYAIKYDFKDELGGNHRLGKGWNSVNIWEDMGVKNWIDYLMSESVQGFAPGYGIVNQFVLPTEYFRNEEDIERWKRSTIYQEQRVDVGRKECLAVLGTPQFAEKLDEHFPMFTNFPTDCTYCEYEGEKGGPCYGPIGYMHNPIASGKYEPRKANHKGER